jgi:hypothetical protein
VGGGKDTLRLLTMLHATNADGKTGFNPSSLSLAEIRLVFVEAPNLPFLINVLRDCVSNLLFTGIVPFGGDGSLEERVEWERLQRAAINEAFSNFTRRIEQLPVWPFTESKTLFLHRLRRGRSDCLRLVTVFTDASCWGVHRGEWNHLDQRDYETVMDFHDWVKAVEAELADLESVATPLPMRDRPLPPHSTDSLPTSEVAATLTLKQAALWLPTFRYERCIAGMARGIVPGVVRQGRVVRIHKQSFDRWLQSGAK